MAKRIPRHIPSLPDPTPVRGGQIIKTKASPISMDTSIMAHDLGNGKFEIADDRFGSDCCCGNNLKCRHCCTESFNKSGGCCYSYKSKNGDNGTAEIEIVDYIYSYELIETLNNGTPYRHITVDGVQVGPSRFKTPTGFNLCGSCFVNVPTEEITRDLLPPPSENKRNFNSMICLGPRSICVKTNVRLWAVAFPLLPVEDCEPSTGNHVLIREFDVGDETGMCFDVNESAHTVKDNLGNSGTNDETWMMSFRVIEKVAPCENIKCKNCL